MARKIESGVFANGFSQKQVPTKNRKSDLKVESVFFAWSLSFCKIEIESCVFAYGFSQKQVPTKNKKSYLKVESVRFAWSFCNSAESSMRWRFTKWCFHLFVHCTLRLLSFRKVEHTMALQKAVYPFFWALHAVVSSGGFETGRTECYTMAATNSSVKSVCGKTQNDRDKRRNIHIRRTSKYVFFANVQNCGRSWRKPKTEVVRWGLEHSWYGGLDYPCRGLYIFPHGYDFEVRWIIFFPIGNRWIRLLGHFKHIILIKRNSEIKSARCHEKNALDRILGG